MIRQRIIPYLCVTAIWFIMLAPILWPDETSVVRDWLYTPLFTVTLP